MYHNNTYRSKELCKSNLDDTVGAYDLLFDKKNADEHPNHVVFIKFTLPVKDNKAFPLLTFLS